ncbi:MAG: peptidoglycan DD-metalloendopeptidase family protein, partial [Caldilinea sp.]|nr:peptidoglycan DD-metalloendopeptidase family protein [Caldilinea sp.]
MRRSLASFDFFQPSDPSGQAGDSQLPSAARQDDKLNGILTHERGTAQVIVPQATRPRRPWKANAVRAAVAVSVVAAGWLLWLRSTDNDGGVVEPAIAAERSAAAEPGTILGLRPTFTPTPVPSATPVPTIDTSELAQIVIVTPTPDPRRAFTVAGAVVDRPLAVAGAERANLGLMGLLPIGDVNFPPQPRFDLSSVRIPPMVEEVVESPITQVEIIPIPGLEVQPAEVAEPEPALAPEPEPLPAEVYEGPTRAWSSFVPAPPEENDHFWVQSAFLGTEYNAVAAPSYQFGSTGGGRYRPHHGIDIANPWGTPVMAGTTGTVIHAGLDDPIVQGPYPNFYGNTVVIQLERKLPVAGGELNAFLLYGHLSRVTVEVGQRVEPGDIVGEVGMTGIAIGPHLHVEMRVGENTYQNSV